MMTYLMIGLGGFLGANTRFIMTQWALERWGGKFPFGTLMVNVIGSFVLCFLTMLISQRLAITPNLRFALTTGFLGSYTTFSTFSLEWLTLMQDGDTGLGIMYIMLSVIVGGLAGYGGFLLGRLL